MMNNLKEILYKNKIKWKTLPVGEKRKKVEELIEMSDDELIKEYNTYITLWQKERGWEYESYKDLFRNKSILEIGSGLGYDGIVFSRYVKKWTFSDIVYENIMFLKRITKLFKVKNIAFEYIEDIFSHNFPEYYEGLYAHGVLHHIPFDFAKKQIENIDRFLKPHSKIVCLMYPKERWEYYGCPKFVDFGKITDGENTPWAEWYDKEKIQKLFGDNYLLLEEKKWGWKNIEFVNFVLEKKGL